MIASAPAARVGGVVRGVPKIDGSANNPNVPDLHPNKVSEGKLVPRFILRKRQRDIFRESTDYEESKDRQDEHAAKNLVTKQN